MTGDIVAVVSVVGAAVGGMVGMATALGYGAKKLVDALSRQLQTQNSMIEDLHHGVMAKLDQHIDSCETCQSKSVADAANVIVEAAKAAAHTVVDAAKAAAKVAHNV